jgi:hypothetical protein
MPTAGVVAEVAVHCALIADRKAIAKSISLQELARKARLRSRRRWAAEIFATNLGELQGEKRITSAVYGFVRPGTLVLQSTRDRMFAGQKDRSKTVLTVACRPDLNQNS